MRKDNKIVRVDSLAVDSYLKNGFDLVEFNEHTNEYDIVRPAKNKTVPYEDYIGVLKELAIVKAELEKLKSATKK